MSKTITYIPTLQEYTRKKKKLNLHSNSFLNSECSSCNYFRSELNVCVYGLNIRLLSEQSKCPMIYNSLEF